MPIFAQGAMNLSILKAQNRCLRRDSKRPSPSDPLDAKAGFRSKGDGWEVPLVPTSLTHLKMTLGIL